MNPQVTVAPSSQVTPLVNLGIISASGPVREVRFRSNGGVHDLFTIVGRSDTPAGCNISQPDFATHVANNDVVFRTPTPTFGAGLIEAIPEAPILALEQRRTNDLLAAIQAHANGGTDSQSEAKQVIQNFNALRSNSKQDVLNFLRSL